MLASVLVKRVQTFEMSADSGATAEYFDTNTITNRLMRLAAVL
jgi:hypothetical protein